MPMEPHRVVAFVEALPGVDALVTPPARYWYYDPRRELAHDKRQPFATLLTSDVSDAHSDLDRRGAFRVNAGVTRATYRAMFGPEPAWNRDGPVATGHDFTRADVFLPHPVYAPMGWVCIVDPSEGSWPRLQDLLREAHAEARRLHERGAPPRA